MDDLQKITHVVRGDPTVPVSALVRATAEEFAKIHRSEESYVVMSGYAPDVIPTGFGSIAGFVFVRVFGVYDEPGFVSVQNEGIPQEDFDALLAGDTLDRVLGYSPDKEPVVYEPDFDVISGSC